MGGRTPGSKLPASPPPLPLPDGMGNPWPCTCVHGPENSSRHAMNCNCGDLRSFLQVWTPFPVVTTTGMSPLSKNCTCGMSVHVCTRDASILKWASTSVLAPSVGLTSQKNPPMPVAFESRFQASPEQTSPNPKVGVGCPGSGLT